MKSFNYFVKVGAVICFYCFQNFCVFAQDQRIADSLLKIYQADTPKGLEKLELLRNLAFNEMEDPDLSIKYAEELIALSSAVNNQEYLYRGYYLKGNTSRSLGNYETALEHLFKSAEIAIEIEDRIKEGSAKMAIADVYSDDGQLNNSEIYYDKAIQILEKTDHSDMLATALLNAGHNYFLSKKYDLALTYYQKADLIFKSTNNLAGSAYYLGNTGMVHAAQGKDDLAERDIGEAIRILEELENFSPISEYLIFMSDIYLKQDKWEIAVNYAQRSLDLAQNHELKKQIANANLQLSSLYEQGGNLKESLKYYKDHIKYRDSITNLESVRKMADLRFNYADAQQEAEINQQKLIKYISIFAMVLVFLSALGLYRRYRYVKNTNGIIEEEKNRSQNLLLNILPKETAQELIRDGKVKAQKFESITVLFTDFVGFTNYAENSTPENLVESVDYYFSKFDEIMEKHNLEKIKTIGDSYMCAGGLHYHQGDHALKMAQAAYEISEFVKETKKEKTINITRFDMRVGINTGPVIAGVVGTRKFAYDIWGDAVNIASRMEGSSEAGKINISENTYELIKDTIPCEYRGEFEVKNKGKMKMYFINDIKDKSMLN